VDANLIETELQCVKINKSVTYKAPALYSPRKNMYKEAITNKTNEPTTYKEQGELYFISVIRLWAIDYGLDGPGSNPGRGEIFRPSRPALGPTQRPVKLVPGLSRTGACY